MLFSWFLFNDKRADVIFAILGQGNTTTVRTITEIAPQHVHSTTLDFCERHFVHHPSIVKSQTVIWAMKLCLSKGLKLQHG